MAVKRKIAALLLAMLGLAWLWRCPVRAAEPSPAPDLTAEQQAALDEAVRSAENACLTEDMTALEKLTALHDWLCLHCDYSPSPRAETAYGALVEGRAVCIGYAAGYAYLAAAQGLEGTWTYSQGIDHAWVLATLDGDRYFTDATWDDGKGARLGMIRHRYFLFDDDNAADTGHTGWDSPEDVPGGPLEEAPWTAAVTRVIFQGDWCWYIDNDMTLWRCRRDTWETEKLLTADGGWPVADQPGYVYTDSYTGLVLIGDRLWFNTPTAIQSVAADGTDLQLELAPDTGEKRIYGIGVSPGGKLCYSVAAAPDDVVYDVIETDIDASEAWGYE